MTVDIEGPVRAAANPPYNNVSDNVSLTIIRSMPIMLITFRF